MNVAYVRGEVGTEVLRKSATLELLARDGIVADLRKLRERTEQDLGTALVGLELRTDLFLLDLCREALHLSETEIHEILGDTTYYGVLLGIGELPVVGTVDSTTGKITFIEQAQAVFA